MIPDRLNDNVGMLGMRLAPFRCKMLLQGWNGPKPSLTLAQEQLTEIDRFGYLGSWNSLDGHKSDKVPSRIQKNRLAFANLRHLWSRHDSRLSIKSRVYTVTAGLVLQCGSEICRLRTVMRRPSVLGHRYRQSSDRTVWGNSANNSADRYSVVGPKIPSLKPTLNQNRVRCPQNDRTPWVILRG